MTGLSGEVGRHRAIPLGLFGMFALVASIEVTAARHSDERAGWAERQADSVVRASRVEAVGADLLCLGDSVIKFGLIPRLIEERTGLRAYNLASSGNPAPISLLTFRRALESGARPKAVVVDFKPFLQVNSRPYVPALARMAGFGEGVALAWAARDGGLLGEFAASWALPTVRDRLTIRSAIRRGLLGLPDPERTSNEALRRNWAINRGAAVLPPIPPGLAPLEFANEAPNLRPDWSCHPVNMAYIDAFFRLASEYRVPVYWLLTPIHPRLQAARDRAGIDAALTRFVETRARASGGGVTVVDARRIGLDPDLFVDATHLDRRGAAALSAALGDFLADRHREAPWVVLPTRPRPVDDPRIEDVGQSALAVRPGLDATRR